MCFYFSSFFMGMSRVKKVDLGLCRSFSFRTFLFDFYIRDSGFKNVYLIKTPTKFHSNAQIFVNDFPSVYLRLNADTNNMNN